MKRKSFVLGVMMCLLLAAPSIAQATEVKTTQFQLENEVFFDQKSEKPDIDVTVNQDNETEVNFLLEPKDDSSDRSFLVFVDPDEAKYQVAEVAPINDYQAMRETLVYSPATRDFTKGMSLTTLDPANIELTKTYFYMSWNRDFSNLSTSVIPWAANPSSLGTHWYYDSHYIAFPGGPSRSCSAFYHNYDFLIPSLRTDVKHYLKLTPTSYGTVIYEGNQKATGEAAILLKFTIQGNIN